MVKIFSSVVAAYVMAGVIGLGIFLFAVPIGTWQAFYASVPATAYHREFRLAIAQGNFQNANMFLSKQAALADFMGMNSEMVRQLVANTGDLMQTARNKSQYHASLPWLSRLSKLAPNNLYVGLMTIEAKIHTGQTVKDEELEQHREITPALDRIYRAAILTNLKQGHTLAIKAWCELYSQSHLGSLDTKHYPDASYINQGMRAFLVEILDKTGKPITLPHTGLELNHTSEYNFEFHRAPQQKSIRLHFPVLPGVKVNLESIQFRSLDSEKIFSANEFVMLPKTGYITSESEFLITSMAGDIITLIPRDGQFPRSDTIRLRMKFSRLPVFSGRECLNR